MLDVVRFPESLGEYLVVRRIGRGGMGHVFEVRHRTSGAARAAKLIIRASDPHARERFRREAQLLQRCDPHPGVVKVHEFGETGEGALYMIMDLVRGEGLDKLLEREERLPARRAAQLCRDVARALGHAHALGIVHRDVKPSNVLLDDTGTARLSDFGLATACDLERLTRTGVFLGTVLYCAPEQTDGGAVGPRSDVFAVGCLLHHALTGRAPLDHLRSPLDILLELRDARPLPDELLREAECPEALARILARAVRKPAAERHANGAELADDLTRFLEGAPASGASAPGTSRRRLAAGRGVLLAGVLLAGVLGAAALAVRARSPGGAVAPAPPPGVAPPGVAPLPDRPVDPAAQALATRAAASLRSLESGLARGEPPPSLGAAAHADLLPLSGADATLFARTVAPLASAVWSTVAAHRLPRTGLRDVEREESARAALLEAFAGLEEQTPLAVAAGLHRLRTQDTAGPAVEQRLRADGRALAQEHPLWSATLLVDAARSASRRAEARVDLDASIAALEALAGDASDPWPANLLHDALELASWWEQDESERGERSLHLEKALALRRRALDRSGGLLQQKRDGDRRDLVSLHFTIAREAHAARRDRREVARHIAAILRFTDDRPGDEKQLVAAELARLSGQLDSALSLADHVARSESAPVRTCAQVVIALARLEGDGDREEPRRLLRDAEPLLEEDLRARALLGLTRPEVRRTAKALDR